MGGDLGNAASGGASISSARLRNQAGAPGWAMTRRRLNDTPSAVPRSRASRPASDRDGVRVAFSSLLPGAGSSRAERPRRPGTVWPPAGGVSGPHAGESAAEDGTLFTAYCGPRKRKFTLEGDIAFEWCYTGSV